MRNGYGESAILSALAEEGFGSLDGRGRRRRKRQFRRWRKRRKERRGARREAETGLSKEERKAGRAARRSCMEACKAQAGFGDFSGNPSTLGYLSDLYTSGFGFIPNIMATVGITAVQEAAQSDDPEVAKKAGDTLTALEEEAQRQQGGGLPKWALPVAAVAAIGGFLWFRSR